MDLRIASQDGQYHVVGAAGEIDDPWPDPLFGLFTGEENWIAVLCGTFWGDLTVRVEQYDVAPEVDRSWDMAGEWTLDCSTGNMWIRPLYGEPIADLTVPAGWLRVRVSVRGRDQASREPEFPPEPIEEHLLQLWPVAEHTDPSQLYGQDELAKY